MAEAKSAVVSKIVTKTEKVPTITLELSVEEAQVIQLLTGNVTGSSLLSPRKHTDAIYKALTKAGVDFYSGAAYGLTVGATRFKNYSGTNSF